MSDTRFDPARLVLLGAALLLAACGGEPRPAAGRTPDPAPVGNYYLGSNPLYAHLTGASGGSWVFTTITRSDAPIDSGYLVRLNDLTPAFDIRVAECAPQAYPTAHRCSLSHPFRKKDAGVIDKIINSSVAVGTAGKITEISQTYETSFDEAEFNKAVDEALVNSGLDLSRKPLIESLDRYDALLAQGQADIERLTQQATTARASTANVTLRIRPEVTGIVDYYGGDIDFSEVVRLSARENTESPAAAALSASAILPCDARYCAATAGKAVSELELAIQSEKTRLSSLIAPDIRAYNVRCDATAFRDYHIALRCPDVIEVSGDQPAELPLGVTVLSRDFSRLYPAFTLSDERLEVSVAGDSVRFRNATADYLTLTAQTVYYNSQVHTTNAPIDLPPGVSIERSLDEFTSPAIGIESSYLQMTPDKAAGSSFAFGYAVRYRVASTAEEITLHDSGRFNVGCVINERLGKGGGACRVDIAQPPPAAPPASEPPPGDPVFDEGPLPDAT